MIAAALALTLAAATAAREVVATVDGSVITRADVAERRRVMARDGAKAPPLEALNALIDETLLASDARSQQAERDPVIRGMIAAEQRRILARALVDGAVASSTIPEEELRRLYHSSGDSIRLVIVKLASKEEAAAALDRVKRGGDLAAEAKRSLDAAAAASGGDTGLRTRGELDPALAAEVFRAPVGSLVGPVELRIGWAIARVTERTIADEAGFASRRDGIAEFARGTLAAQTRSHLVAQLKAKTPVKIDEGFLKSLGNRVEATPKELEHLLAEVGGTRILYADIYGSVAQMTATTQHASGPGVKLSFAQGAVDDALLAAAAVGQHLETTPAVAAALPAAERRLLSRAAAVRASTAKGSATPAAKVGARVAELRARAKVQIDEAALAALATGTPSK